MLAPNFMRFLLILLLVFVAGCAAQGTQRVSTNIAPRTQATSGRAQAPQSVPILLALPLSNEYGSFANSVLDGANAAVRTLGRRGVSISLTVVDTAKSNWIQAVQEAPASTVIGGPMIPQDLQALLSASPRRAVFAMMSEFPSASIQEGRDAWRFFTSSQDHIRASLQAARSTFGVQDIGVLYPEESFGQRQAQIFQTVAQKEGFAVKASQGYTPDDPLQWQQQVADFLEAGYTSSSAASNHPGMQAVYLPDVWSKAQMLVPHFFYYQEDHMLILGSALWGQTLDMQAEDSHTFRLSYFPGAWWIDNPSSATRALQQEVGQGEADYWHGVGFDFIRLAAHMGPLPSQPTPAAVNGLLLQAQNMEWSMAPLRWSGQGVAAQELFLFSPTPNGPARANMSLLAREYSDAARRFQSRMNMAP